MDVWVPNMAKDYTKVLLITANVGSIFEDVSQFTLLTPEIESTQQLLIFQDQNFVG